MLSALFELAGICNLWVIAELVLDGAHLLVQEVLALLFVEVFAHFILNFIAHFEDLDLGGEVLEHHHDAFFHVHFFEHSLFFGDIRIHIGRDEIDQETWTVDIADGKLCFGGDIGAFADDLQGEVFNGIEHDLEFFIGGI